MSKTSVRLSVAFLFLTALPIGCLQSCSSEGAGDSSKTGGAGGGSGGSSARGGSMGGNGGSSARGGSSGTGGDATGGSSTTGGGGGNGGSSEATGGASGAGGDGTGGMSTGGSGGIWPSDGGTGTGKPGDAQDDAVEAVGTCTDNTQNNAETDIDCGGGTCPRCGSGQKCDADSDCRTGTCSAGKCLDGFAATAPVTKNGNMWRIALGSVIFEVDPGTAGKVSTFSIDGTDVVAKNIAATGSEFWTSPQDGWYTNGNTWPPPNEMTSSEYTPSSSNNVLTMTGPAWGGGLAISKRFWGNSEHQAVTLEYTIENGTSAAVSNAPWEITRVYAGGLTFFPNADAWVKLGGIYSGFTIVPVTTSQGVVWFNDNATSYTSNVKGGSDGLEGWAAHIVCGTGLKKTCATGAASPILIKQWADTPASNVTLNASEREVEIYVDQSNTYEEFEQQGLFQ
ncbi:MAG TPA: hypothetical protein VF550_08160, partial [Polyangia bacterium]